MRRALSVLLAMLPAVSAPAADAPPGPFANDACVGCHDKETPTVVAGWRRSVHASAVPAVDCIACHGDRHPGAATRARRNEACTACHGGPKESVVRSYLTSKHGVIAAIEARRWDWTRKLADANYRSPTCPYCHLRTGQHDVGRGIAFRDSLREGTPATVDQGREAMEDACRDCHSARYVGVLAASGGRTMEIARLKVSEAEGILEKTLIDAVATETDETADVEELHRRAEAMRLRSMNDLWRGIAHHSPDYQWWYGQAALDGDLVRVKAVATKIWRKRTLAAGADGGKEAPRPTRPGN